MILFSLVWSPDGQSIVAGALNGNIYMWDASFLNPSKTHAESLSSSILNLPARPTPPPPPLTNSDDGPCESDDWEYSTNESSDSLLDLPAVGAPNSHATKRKGRRRRAAPGPQLEAPLPFISVRQLVLYYANLNRTSSISISSTLQLGVWTMHIFPFSHPTKIAAS
ncbi:hypothetical protein BJ138DRAFT_1117061 [Hygrophoropsis aurantiaca]|uniref:Uncharacterized protein n=1 Tax=Hygrophoropsis aurantiaca TaxID=72124 RepID=A0ACB8A2T0_9AGAM|nr:hypothetical protein BJ138DRAFT_1117061 [Hygrophoropsis aurantiaca]